MSKRSPVFFLAGWGVADMTRKMPPPMKWIVRIGFCAGSFALSGMLK